MAENKALSVDEGPHRPEDGKAVPMSRLLQGFLKVL